MINTAKIYVEHLAERSMRDLANCALESFGRCDCVMFGEETLIIKAYKHGKGVPVSIKENLQMMQNNIRSKFKYMDLPRRGIVKTTICER